jgi:hypothetical protein
MCAPSVLSGLIGRQARAPPLMVQTFFIGLVSEKISSGETSAGFKHAVILMLVALAILPLASYVTAPLQGGFG